MSETQKGGNLCDQVKIQKAKAKEKASQRERDSHHFFLSERWFPTECFKLGSGKIKKRIFEFNNKFWITVFFFFFAFVNHENEIVEFGGVNILGAAYGNIKLNKWFFFFLENKLMKI